MTREPGETEFILDPAEYERLLVERYHLAITFLGGLPPQPALAPPCHCAAAINQRRAQLLRLGEQLAHLLGSNAVIGATAPSDNGSAATERTADLARLVTGFASDRDAAIEIQRLIVEFDASQREALAEIIAILGGDNREIQRRAQPRATVE